ncbi:MULTISPECIES: hypothetical protein [unclassified Streptomyces]|uniref:hypothetical protein n=1 Tax=unclassified Streptomyces TaxID=2593676 RepID=UPI000AF1A9FC|nr:hypothetical protein [Streptomyces sp. TSRI0107]
MTTTDFAAMTGRGLLRWVQTERPTDVPSIGRLLGMGEQRGDSRSPRGWCARGDVLPLDTNGERRCPRGACRAIRATRALPCAP